MAAVESQLAPHRIREHLGLSRERMARLLDVSTRTVERWEQRADLPASLASRARLAKLQQIVDLGQVVYGPDGLRRFVMLPMPVFGRGTALQLIEMGEADRVYGAIAADYEGQGF
ncbi:MAG: helix-turn-helix domain-containing protein [Chloroflexi bacterium]|nr:helix-turn-helix domain-containing protein [Chloroflexota bacterium]